MTKISGDIEADYRDATAAGRQAIVEKLQRYIDRGLWAQSVMQAVRVHDALPPREAPTDAAEATSTPEQITAATGKPKP